MATSKRFIAKNGLDNNNNSITNVINPTAASDAATKNYVDTFVGSTYITTVGTLGHILNVTTSGQIATMVLTDAGTNGVSIKLIGNGSTTPNKYIRVINGNLEFINSAYTAAIASFTDSGQLTVPSLVVSGNLTVNGATTTINATTLTVTDKNIELGTVGSPSDTTADQGGITLRGLTNKTIIWDSASANWNSSEHWNLASGKVYRIGGNSVLSASTLGSTVTSSSLTSIGTLSSLNVLHGLTTLMAAASTASYDVWSGALQIREVGGIGNNQFTSTASSIMGTTLTVGGTITGTVVVGAFLSGTGILANTMITARGTGTGGAGTYTVNLSQTAASRAINAYVDNRNSPAITFHWGNVVATKLMMNGGGNFELRGQDAEWTNTVYRSLIASTYESKAITGTPPLYVASTTMVANLNANYLGGQASSYYQQNVRKVNLLELGADNSGNIYTYIDFKADDTYTDYGLRLYRANGGANSNSGLISRGTGGLYLTTQDNGHVVFQTNSTDRGYFHATDGNLYLYNNLILDHAASSAMIQLDSNAGYSRYNRFSTNGLARWDIGCSNEAESGADAGSNFYIARFRDDGSPLAWPQWMPFHINRATGLVSMNGGVGINADGKSLSLGASADLWIAHDGTNSIINNATGHLYITNTTVGGAIIIQSENTAGANLELWANTAIIDSSTTYFRSQNDNILFGQFSLSGFYTAGNTDWPVRSVCTGATNTSRGGMLQQRSLDGGAITSGTQIGGLSVGGHNGTAFTSGWNGGAEMLFQATQNWTPTANGTEFSLWLSADNTTTPTNRFSINQNGNIGLISQSGHVNISNTATTGSWLGLGFNQMSASASSAQNIFIDFRNELSYPKANIHSTLYMDGSSELRFGITKPGIARNTDSKIQTFFLTNDGNAKFTGNLTTVGTGIFNGSPSQNQLQLTSTTTSSGYGVIHRNDGFNYYILLTNDGDALGAWNGLRPFSINNNSGAVTMNNGATIGNNVNNRITSIDSNGIITARYDDNALPSNLIFRNLSTGTTTGHGNQMLWQFCTNTSQSIINAGAISVIKNNLWTSTASTQNSAMSFNLSNNGNFVSAAYLNQLGHFYVNYINCVADVTAITPSHIAMRYVDNFMRWQTWSQFKTNLFSSDDIKFNGLLGATGCTGVKLESATATGIGFNVLNAAATKSAIIHMGVGTDIRFGRYADNFGAWEANPFTFDIVTGAMVAAGSITAGAANFTTSGQSATIVLTDAGTNGVSIKLIGNGSTTPNKYIRVINGNLEFINSAYANVIASITDSGSFNIAGSINAASITASLGGRLSLNGHGFAISDKVDISNRVDSGFWQNSAATAATGWPSTSNSNWWHCISATHSNESNYFSMQFASSFFNSNELYFRQTNNSGTTGWFKMFHSGNFEAWFGIGSNYTAVNRDCLLAHTGNGAFTITLPASPTQGMFVKIADAGGTFATNNLTVARNGSNILGSATDLVLDVNNDSVYLVYYGGTRGWILA